MEPAGRRRNNEHEHPADDRDPTSPGHWFWQASQWLADVLGVPVVEMPGAHVPQVSHPGELVATLREELAQARAQAAGAKPAKVEK